MTTFQSHSGQAETQLCLPSPFRHAPVQGCVSMGSPQFNGSVRKRVGPSHGYQTRHGFSLGDREHNRRRLLRSFQHLSPLFRAKTLFCLRSINAAFFMIISQDPGCATLPTRYMRLPSIYETGTGATNQHRAPGSTSFSRVKHSRLLHSAPRCVHFETPCDKLSPTSSPNEHQTVSSETGMLGTRVSQCLPLGEYIF